MSRKNQQKVYPWSVYQFQNQSFSSVQSGKGVNLKQVNKQQQQQQKLVPDYAESNQFTRKAQFNNLFDVYETEIARLENHVFQLVHEINNLHQNSCHELANYDQKLLMHAKLNERLFQENQDILRMNDQLLSENKRLKCLLEEKKNTPVVVKIKQEKFFNDFDSQMEDDESRPEKASTGLDQLKDLINNLKNETENNFSKEKKLAHSDSEVAPPIYLNKTTSVKVSSPVAETTYQVTKSFNGVVSKRSADKKKVCVKKKSVYRKLFNLK